MTDTEMRIASEFVLSDFNCGHVGRDNESDRSKTKAFIRVAELRMMPVKKIDKPCPECKR